MMELKAFGRAFSSLFLYIYFISSHLSFITCKLSECLFEKELAALSADLVVLGDMLANIIAHQTFCSPETDLSECDDLSP